MRHKIGLLLHSFNMLRRFHQGQYCQLIPALSLILPLPAFVQYKRKDLLRAEGERGREGERVSRRLVRLMAVLVVRHPC